jgi:hypothetical protein
VKKHRYGFLSLSLALFLAAGCAGDHQSTTGEEHGQAAEETEEMADPTMEGQAMEMDADEAAMPAAPAPAKPAATTAKPAMPSTTGQGSGTTAPAPSTTTAMQPAAPSVPMIQIPAGTTMILELKTDLSTATNMPGDEFKARVLEPVTMGGVVVIPERSRVWGTVTETVSAQKMKGQAQMSLSFDRLELPDGTFHAMSAMLTEEGVKVGKRTGAVIGGSAAGGALLGKIIGKDTKSAVKGALIGAAVGTGIAASQKGQDLEIPGGSEMNIVLDAALELPEPK